MTGGISASTATLIAAGVSAAAAVGTTVYSSMNKPKAPDAITAPPPPSVSQANEMADEENQTNQRKGALANLLNNGSSPSQQMTSANASLRSILGG